VRLTARAYCLAGIAPTPRRAPRPCPALTGARGTRHGPRMPGRPFTLRARTERTLVRIRIDEPRRAAFVIG